MCSRHFPIIDINGAFDSTFNASIKEAMDRHGPGDHGLDIKHADWQIFVIAQYQDPDRNEISIWLRSNKTFNNGFDFGFFDFFRVQNLENRTETVLIRVFCDYGYGSEVFFLVFYSM